MHTYIKVEDYFVVGYWLPHSGDVPKWMPLSDHQTERLAILRVNFLNGGSASQMV